MGLYLVQSGPRVSIGRALGERGEVAGRIVNAGSLDFAGDYRGRAVMFDAKSTESRTRFDLRLISPHQAVIVKQAHQRGTIAFFLIELGAGSPSPRYYALTWPVLASWWKPFEDADAGYGPDAPASIPALVLEAESIPVTRERHGLNLVGAIRELQVQIRPAAG